MGKVSKEEIIQRILFYKTNYLKFIEDFGKIRVPGGIVPFRMFEYQKELARNLQNHDFNIILKARQLGISTIVGAYLGTYIIFNPHSDIIIVAINEDVAKELVLKIKIFLEGLPSYLRPEITNPRNKESIELKNGSRVKALTSTSKAGRSFTASFLVMDEAAFIDNAHELYTAAYPTLSNGGRCIMLSTPGDEGNLFHNIWVGAENKENEFQATKLYWWDMPGRDEKWKRRTIANLGFDMRKFRKEYECDFASGSRSVIGIEKVNTILKRNSQNGIVPIENFATKSGNKYEELRVYKEPVPEHVYLISVDTAEGLGEERDASAMLCLDVMTNEVVMEYDMKDLNEKSFAKVVKDVGETFNDALLIIELKSTGKLVANYLLEWGYKNIFWSDRRMSIYLDPMTDKSIPNQFDYDKSNAVVPGFVTNGSNKVLIINEMKNAVEEDEIINIYAKRMLEQQKTFINKGGMTQPKYGASGRNNDDLVMCMALLVYVRKYIWKIMENNNTLNEQILTYFSRNVEDMTENQAMSESMVFSPIYNTRKMAKQMNPYKFGQLGDVRCYLG